MAKYDELMTALDKCVELHGNLSRLEGRDIKSYYSEALYKVCNYAMKKLVRELQDEMTAQTDAASAEVEHGN